MTKPQYIVHWSFLPTFFGVLFFFILPIIMGFVLPFVANDYRNFAILCIPVFWGMVLFVFRKFFFAKIFIDNEGVKLTYKGMIRRQIEWTEMKKIIAQRTTISFHRTDDNKMWLTKNFISLNTSAMLQELGNICKVINENKGRIANPIELSKAEPSIAGLLR